MIERGYSFEKVMSNIQKRTEDNSKYISPQQYNSDIIITYFTNNDLDYEKVDYDNLDFEPNIYLKISSKKDIYGFLKILNENNIEYCVEKTKDLNSVIFYNILFYRIFIK